MKLRSEQMEKKNILLISAHPPIDYELIREWLKSGHNVSIVSLNVRWDDQFSELTNGVSRGLPAAEPDAIICGSEKDLPYSFLIKLHNKWFNTRIIMIHWWIPNWNPLLYLVRNVSVCEYGRKLLISRQFIDSRVVYCPVDVKTFRPIDGMARKKRVICIGNNFKNRKVMGYDHLIDIITRIHAISPEIEIGVIGKNDPADYPEYVDVRSLNKEQMVNEIASSSAVFFTTTRNLIMNSMQIAMSCGKPVVAFDLEPFREVIRDGESGFLIQCFDTHSFALKLVDIVMNRYEEVGRKAREIIVEKCESSKVASQIISVIDR